MADWNNPTLSSAYSDFLDNLKSRDEDSVTLLISAPTNPITGMMKWVRDTSTTGHLQEYQSGAFSDEVLTLSGGGTGAANASGARTNLGLGSIATQDSNNVTITGGSISGLASFSVSGNITIGGQILAGSGPVTLTTAGGKIQAITSTYFASLSFDASNLTGTSAAINGSLITALNASNLGSGTVPTARLGSGTANNTTFLRGDQTWASVAVSPTIYNFDGTHDFTGAADYDLAIGATVDLTKSYIVPRVILIQGGTSYSFSYSFLSTSVVRIHMYSGSGVGTTLTYGYSVVSWG